MIIFADSIGYAGTKTMAKILSDAPNTYITHGPLMNTDQNSPDNKMKPLEYLEFLQQLEGHYETVVSMHALYRPYEIIDLCKDKGIQYYFIVRNQANQIQSCYAWALEKILVRGKIDMLGQMYSISKSVQRFTEPTLANCLYTYALLRVCSFNVEAISMNAAHIKMEDLLNSENTFKSIFNINTDHKIPHFHGDTVLINSHKNRMAKYEIGTPDKGSILENTIFNQGDLKLRYGDICKILGYNE